MGVKSLFIVEKRVKGIFVLVVVISVGLVMES